MDKAQLDVDKPFARHIYDLLKARQVEEFSFPYDDVVDSRQAEDGANELTALELIEVGPTLKGINPETQLLTVEGAGRDHHHDDQQHHLRVAGQGWGPQQRG